MMDIEYIKNNITIYDSTDGLLSLNSKFKYDTSKEVEKDLPTIYGAFENLNKSLRGNIVVYYTEHRVTDHVFDIDIMEVKRLFSLYIEDHSILTCVKEMVGRYVVLRTKTLDSFSVSFRIKEFDFEAYDNIMSKQIHLTIEPVPEVPLSISKLKSRQSEITVIYDHLYRNKNFNSTRFMTYEIFKIMSSLNSLDMVKSELYCKGDIIDEVSNLKNKLINEIFTNSLNNTTLEKSESIIKSILDG